MIDVKPCPFCKDKDRLRMGRMDVVAPLGTPCVMEMECKFGDRFYIDCDCGCRLEKCTDELMSIFYDVQQHPSEDELTEEKCWEIVVDEWNKGYSCQ